jgi:drug/metabolite transporter (DMT)-like permease
MRLNPRYRATAALLLVTLIWGATFSWMKIALDAAAAELGEAGDDVAVGLFLALRFTMAAITLPLIVPAARRQLRQPAVWKGGMILAFFVVLGFALQMVGLQDIDPATSAFLTSLYVLFTALIAMGRDRAAPPLLAWVGISLATLGALLIANADDQPLLIFLSGLTQHFGTAELLTILCGVAFAGHIVATDSVTRKVAPLPVTTTTFVVTSLACIGLFVIALMRSSLPTGQVMALVTVWPFFYPVALCSLLGTVGVLSLLNIFQRELSPVRAAIIFSLEPVWAALIALGMGQTEANLYFIIGASTLLAGNLVMELAPKEEPSEA